MTKQRELGEANSSRLLAYEDFQPSYDWTHDSNCHVLLVDLPGFKKEELKVQVDNSWKVTISGEKELNESKRTRFKQAFDVPKDSDIDKISGRFDGGLLFVIIPRKATAKMEELKSENVKEIGKEEKKQEQSSNAENPNKKHEHEHLHNGKKDERERIEAGIAGLVGEKGKKREREDWRKKMERVREKEGLEVFMENAKEVMSKNKAVIVTAVLAISVGLYITHRLRLGGR